MPRAAISGSPIRWSARGRSISSLSLVSSRTSIITGTSRTLARFLSRLGSFSRLILFDKRGTGSRIGSGTLPTLEERMDDVRAVMDAVRSKRAALFGISEGGAMSMLFAATYPERTQA